MKKIKAALHEHLKTSSKLKKGSFDKAIEYAIWRLGFHCIFGIADFDDKRYKHFIEMDGFDREYIGEDRRAVRIKSYGDNVDVGIVHGEEVPTKQGHLLVKGLGADTYLKHERTIEDTIKEARDYNPHAVIILDHAFGWRGCGDYIVRNLDILRKVDAIEGFNAEDLFGNKKARKFYMQQVTKFPHLGFISTSDGHSWYEFCRTWTELDKPDYSSADKFSQTFRRAVQSTDEYTTHSNNYLAGFFGAAVHAWNLEWILKIAPKLGLKSLYETERPDNK